MPFSIRTEGDFSYRDEVIERAAEFWGDGKTKGVIRSCEEAPESARARREALEVLAREIDPTLLDEVASVLETRHVGFSWSVRGEGEGDVEISVDVELDG